MDCEINIWLFGIIFEWGIYIRSTTVSVIFFLSGYAYPFYEPVDHVALKLADYTRIVTKPMDLGTVRKNLNDGLYHEPEEVHADVKLMFSNCFIYNPATHDVTKMGKKLDLVFDKRYFLKNILVKFKSRFLIRNSRRGLLTGYFCAIPIHPFCFLPKTS